MFNAYTWCWSIHRFCSQDWKKLITLIHSIKFLSMPFRNQLYQQAHIVQAYSCLDLCYGWAGSRNEYVDFLVLYHLLLLNPWLIRGSQSRLPKVSTVEKEVTYQFNTISTVTLLKCLEYQGNYVCIYWFVKNLGGGTFSFNFLKGMTKWK